MEVAVEWDFWYKSGELLPILAEFTEMPDDVKIFRLSKLMHLGENKAKEKEEFKTLLGSLSAVELVSLQPIDMNTFAGEQHQYATPTFEWKSSAQCCA